jgi:cell division septation protein DedD
VVARATPPQQPAPAPSALGSDAGPAEYVVQLAARRNEQQALDAYSSLRSRYSNLLGRYQPLIQRTDLGQAGIYYRVRVGPMASAAAATELCDQLKAAGLPDCLVRQR